MARQRGVQGALGTSQAGIEGRVQGGVVALGQEGQAGHGHVVVGLAMAKLIARPVRRSVRVMA